MANPQIEDGYTRVANELIEAICYKVANATWIKILLWTMRLTYGFKRKEVQSNYQSYATKLSLTKETIRHALLDMAEHRLITFVVVTNNIFIVSINKNYELWKI